MKKRVPALALLVVSLRLFAQEAPPSSPLEAALPIIEKKYLKQLDRATLEEKALQSLLKDLDPYSNYLNPTEWADFHANFAETFGGIGVVLEPHPESGLQRIRALLVGSAAGAAGVRRGDLVVSIGGKAIKGLPIEDVIPILRGVPGTVVDLVVRREGKAEPIHFRIARVAVPQPTVRGARREGDGADDYLLERQDGIGFIRILRFGDDTLKKVHAALDQLRTRGMRGLVLDLRDSMGGQLRAARCIADLFLEKGLIVRIQEPSGTEDLEATAGVDADVPMVMLVNGQTASAAEVLAGALADHGKAIVVGERTWGKGRIQQMFKLSSGGGIKLTTATFQRPSGRTIDRHDAKRPEEAGIAPEPGMEVALAAEELEAWRKDMIRFDSAQILTPEEQKPAVPDRVLARGLEVLANLLDGPPKAK